MYYDPHLEFAYERRGRNYYAFCDKGCKVIIRPKYGPLKGAMESHAREHDGQMALALFPRTVIDPDGVPPF